ncbi:EndoU domain-containing protein [Phytomonospora sp. NPDC050363]|uniref:EndoU domain-containing protein n=1 Tax=Phytomonospora sp. NPDC050363 TaxID=3155642 RepID=UPI0033FF3CF5
MTKGPGGKGPRPSPAMMGKFGKKISQDANLLRKTDPPGKAPDAPDAPKGPRRGGWDNDPEMTKIRDGMTRHGECLPSREHHILHGDINDQTKGGHLFGTGRPGKTEFPEGWDEDRVMDEVKSVTDNPASTPVKRYNENGDDIGWTVSGTRDGVQIQVHLNRDGSIWSAYPTGGPGVHTNPR